MRPPGKYDMFDKIYNLECVPIATVQLRFNGWVTEMQDDKKMMDVSGDQSDGRGAGIDKLIVCGNTLDCCVHSTLRSANDMNYQTLLLSDCCGCVEAEVPGLRAAMIASVGVEGGLFGTVCESAALLAALGQ